MTTKQQQHTDQTELKGTSSLTVSDYVPATPQERLVLELQQIALDANGLAMQKVPAVVRAMKLSAGITAMRKMLTDQLIKEHFLPLQGNKLGFKTDKDREGGYDIATIRDVLIEAFLRDFLPVDNEFNIIAGQFYGAQNGFVRKLREFPGLANLECHPGVPNTKDGAAGALVSYRVTYLLDGKPQEYLRIALKDDKDRIVRDERIAVKINQGMGPDAILGKAKRKVLAALYEKLAGITVPDGEIIDTVAVEVAERKSAAQQAQEMVERHQQRTAERNGNGNGAKPQQQQPAAVNEDGEVVG